MGGGRRRSGRQQGRGAALRTTAFAAALALPGLSEAWAGEGYAIVGVGGGVGGALASAVGGALGDGLGDNHDGLNAYAGLIYAPAHSLSDSGPLLRAWAKSLEFTYRADWPTEPDVPVRAIGYGVHLEAGWQIARPRWRAALLPGIAWRDYKLVPSDPDSSLEQDRIALSLAAEGEWRFSDRFGIMANGSYLTGFDDYWAQARPFLHLGGGWKVGLDVAAWGGPDHARMRAGAFTSGYELPVKAFSRRLFLGAEAGVQCDRDGKRLAPFGGINIGLLF